MKITTLIVSSVALFFLSSCNYNNFKELNPTKTTNSTCDTAGVMSYSAQIVPILNANCITCHDGSTATNLVGHAATTNAYPLGDFYAAVAHLGGGVQTMPKNASKLPECDIAKIKKWIDAGAPNN